MPKDTAPPKRAPTPLRERAETLRDWFEANARSFPWRANRTPYRVWISEAMLQQTRAATVEPYFARWMDTFPDVEALAHASEEEVLAVWEGLGYYRRARALHAAAREIAFERAGDIPRTEDDWRALPGVGPYTAAAVCALAFAHPVIAVDGNVRRVGARLLAEARPSDSDLRRRLSALVTGDAGASAAEALIELGATVCTPRAPRCGVCPLAPACAAYRAGEPTAYPEKRARTAPPTRRRWAIVAIDEAGRVVLERRPSDGLLGGLWGFPQVASSPVGEALDALTQAYSHFRLELIPVVVATSHAASADDASSGDAAFDAANGDAANGDASSDRTTDRFDATEAANLPLSRVDRRLLDRLLESGLLASNP